MKLKKTSLPGTMRLLVPVFAVIGKPHVAHANNEGGDR